MAFRSISILFYNFVFAGRHICNLLGSIVFGHWSEFEVNALAKDLRDGSANVKKRIQIRLRFLRVYYYSFAYYVHVLRSSCNFLHQQQRGITMEELIEMFFDFLQFSQIFKYLYNLLFCLFFALF